MAGWSYLSPAANCFVNMVFLKKKKESFSEVEQNWEGNKRQFKLCCLQVLQEHMFSLTSSSAQNFQRKVNQRSLILNPFWYVPMENKHHFKTFFSIQMQVSPVVWHPEMIFGHNIIF